MEIGILGCGSLGGVIAGKLWAVYGDAVRVFELNPGIVAAVRKEGLRIVDGRRSLVAHPRIVESPDDLSEPLDLVILTTKSTTLNRAVEAFLPHLSEEGFFMTVQNGLAALDLIERYGGGRIAAGCVMWGSSMPAPGRCVVTARGPFVVGGLAGRESPQAVLCRKTLENAFPVKMSGDMRDVLWSKLTVTASLTSLGAITGLRFGEMLKSRTIRGLILRVGQEVVEVGRASGVGFRHSEGALNVNLIAGERFPPRWVRHLLIRAIGFKHRRTESSMHASNRAGSPTEIDYINGVVVGMGKRLGVTTAVNEAIVTVVREIESGSRVPGPESRERLAALLPPKPGRNTP